MFWKVACGKISDLWKKKLLPRFKVTWDYSEVRCGIFPEEKLQSL